MIEPEPTWHEYWHDLLLEIAGQVPDELISHARSHLADDDHEAVARAMAHAITAYRLTFDDQRAELFAAAGLNIDAIGGIDPTDLPDAMPYAFGSAPPGVPAPQLLDLTPRGIRDLDSVEVAAVLSVVGDPGVCGLWRCWRTPGHDSGWPEPKRIFLIEVSRRRDRHPLAARITEVLDLAGERAPQVEVFATRDGVPEYQLLARDAAALLWAPGPAVTPRLARVLPETSDAEQPRIADGLERHRLATYLESAEAILIADVLGDDVLDPPRGAVVPLDIRTDGTWMWSDALAYYVREHGIAPEPDLRRHIEASGHLSPAVGSVARFRCLAALAEPVEDRPAAG